MLFSLCVASVIAFIVIKYKKHCLPRWGSEPGLVVQLGVQDSETVFQLGIAERPADVASDSDDDNGCVQELSVGTDAEYEDLTQNVYCNNNTETARVLSALEDAMRDEDAGVDCDASSLPPGQDMH